MIIEIPANIYCSVLVETFEIILWFENYRNLMMIFFLLISCIDLGSASFLSPVFFPFVLLFFFLIFLLLVYFYCIYKGKAAINIYFLLSISWNSYLIYEFIIFFWFKECTWVKCIWKIRIEEHMLPQCCDSIAYIAILITCHHLI